MAFPTAVNSQITDSVTQANLQVVGEAPAQALASLYMAIAESMSIAAQNATANQQNGNSLAAAVTTRLVESLVSSPRT